MKKLDLKKRLRKYHIPGSILLCLSLLSTGCAGTTPENTDQPHSPDESAVVSSKKESDSQTTSETKKPEESEISSQKTEEAPNQETSSPADSTQNVSPHQENSSDQEWTVLDENGTIQTGEAQVLESIGLELDPDLIARAIADEVPAYDDAGVMSIPVNEDVPTLTWNSQDIPAFEYYGDLDQEGRCTIALANVGKETLPEGERGDISAVKPSGFVQNQYDFVDSSYLYNRAHLIAFCLSAENANEKNLITGTRSMNMAMVPYETKVADYVKSTGNHVMYRSIPVFSGDNLVCDGVLLEAKSVEDNGAGISFCRYIYNVEPGVEIDYATGENWVAEEDTPTWTYDPANDSEDSGASENSAVTVQPEEESGGYIPEGAAYIANKNSGVFHYADCSSVKRMKETNKIPYTTSAQALADGYRACEKCNP